MTMVIQIGNSDNKLSQADWSRFVSEIDELISDHRHQNHTQIHFRGGSSWDSQWQNACWVIDHIANYSTFEKRITQIRKKYLQDSVAITYGETEFV